MVTDNMNASSSNSPIAAPPAKLGYTVNESVNVTGIGRSKLYEYMRIGRLKYVKSGTRTIITHPALLELLADLEAETQRRAADPQKA
jgi:hypothetical protein